MPRFRITIRQMMVVVVVAAVIIAPVAMRRRTTAFMAIAEAHKGEIFGIEEESPYGDEWEKFWFSDKPIDPPRHQFIPPGPPSDPPGPEEKDPKVAAWRNSQRRRIAHHEKMIDKYERAARYPWLFVEPDPPAPE